MAKLTFKFAGQCVQNGKTFYQVKTTLPELARLDKAKKLVIEDYDNSVLNKLVDAALSATEDKTLSFVEKILKDVGYQRKVSEKKVSNCCVYITAPSGFFPCPLLINIRKGDEDYCHYDSKTGTLTIDEKAVFYIYDGQHRLKGLIQAYDNNKEFTIDVSLSISVGLSKAEEMWYFAKGNKECKPLNSAHVMDIFSMLASIEYQGLPLKGNNFDMITTLTVISHKLNLEKKSPLRGFIKGANQKKGRPNSNEKYIKQATMVHSLKPLWYLLHKDHKDDNVELIRHITAVVIAYWGALKQKMSDAFSADPEIRNNYFLTTSASPIETFNDALGIKDGFYERAIYANDDPEEVATFSKLLNRPTPYTCLEGCKVERKVKGKVEKKYEECVWKKVHDCWYMSKGKPKERFKPCKITGWGLAENAAQDLLDLTAGKVRKSTGKTDVRFSNEDIAKMIVNKQIKTGKDFKPTAELASQIALEKASKRQFAADYDKHNQG